MSSAIVIESIQFKRGTKSSLTLNLTTDVLGVLAAGEPAWETDTNLLKIGDGVSNYADLEYLHSTDDRFVITSPTENQLLVYDVESSKWINRPLSDAESIVYLSTKGLTIKGYADANHGQMLVKDRDEGIVWIDPLDSASLDSAVAQASASASMAGSAAVTAGNSATTATEAAALAQNINTQTVDYITNKFWWGTLAEYNALTEIHEDTFYFIKPGN